MAERDNVLHLGGSLDELVRHHPFLRATIISTTLEVLDHVIQEASQPASTDTSGLKQLTKIFKVSLR
jgi:hypothetical protein